jgi:hypothetical protein
MKTICSILLGLSLAVGTAAFGAEKIPPKSEQSKTPSKATEKAKAKSEATTKIPQTKGQVNQKTTKGKAGEPKAQ